MNTTRRTALVGAATAAAAAVTATAHAKPLPSPYDRLSRRLATIRGRLSLRRRGEAPEVAELRRAVVALVGVVEDLVSLENTRTDEPR